VKYSRDLEPTLPELNIPCNNLSYNKVTIGSTTRSSYCYRKDASYVNDGRNYYVSFGYDDICFEFSEIPTHGKYTITAANEVTIGSQNVYVYFKDDSYYSDYLYPFTEGGEIYIERNTEDNTFDIKFCGIEYYDEDNYSTKEAEGYIHVNVYE